MDWDTKFVKPLSDYRIYVELEDGHKGIFDLKPERAGHCSADFASGYASGIRNKLSQERSWLRSIARRKNEK